MRVWLDWSSRPGPFFLPGLWPCAHCPGGGPASPSGPCPPNLRTSGIGSVSRGSKGEKKAELCVLRQQKGAGRRGVARPLGPTQPCWEAVRAPGRWAVGHPGRMQVVADGDPTGRSTGWGGGIIGCSRCGTECPFLGPHTLVSPRNDRMTPETRGEKFPRLRPEVHAATRDQFRAEVGKCFL